MLTAATTSELHTSAEYSKHCIIEISNGLGLSSTTIPYLMSEYLNMLTPKPLTIQMVADE